MKCLEIKNLSVSVEATQILTDVNLKIKSGEIAGIMGRNGSGKSTLARVIFGHPDYKVTDGDILFDNQSLLELRTDARAKLGLFLGFQGPLAIEGVTLSNFLRTSLHAQNPDEKLENPIKYHRRLRADLKEVGLESSFISRGVNEKASGGERKKGEMVQMKHLKPKIAILDEIDSGLDIDAMRVVANEIIKQKERDKTGFLLITHYNRLLTYTKPDVVHLMDGGSIIRSGGPQLAEELEQKGYQSLISE